MTLRKSTVSAIGAAEIYRLAKLISHSLRPGLTPGKNPPPPLGDGRGTEIVGCN